MLALVTATCGGGGTARAADWQLSGYVKPFLIAYDPRRLSDGDLIIEQEVLWANNNRLRLNGRWFRGDWLMCEAAYDLALRIQHDALFEEAIFLPVGTASIYRVRDLNPIVWPDAPGRGDHVAIFHNLDRLAATWTAPHFDLIVGRQVIAWGSARAVNPTDIIAPFLYTEIDTEDRVGVDAARLRAPIGLLGEIDAGYVAGEDFAWRESAAFARGRFNVARTDLTVLGMTFRENLLLGFDAIRAIGGAGLWGEGAYVWVDAFDDRTPEAAGHDYLRLSIGSDYNFGHGIYGFLEYHLNGAGSRSATDYLENLRTPAYREGAVYLLGRQYLIPGMTYELTALSTVFVEALFNLTDGSTLLAPYIEYSVAENVYLSLGAYLGLGAHPGILAPMGGGGGAGAASPRFRSEFGAYPQSYYAFLRYYF